MQVRIAAFLKSLRPLLEVLHSECRQFSAGETVVRENERDDALFFLEKGQVRIIWGADKFELAVVQAPEVLGELAYLQNASHSATAVAIDECSVIILPRNAVQKLKDIRPDLHEHLYEYLLEILASRFRYNADMRHQLAVQKKEISELSDKLKEMDRLKSRFFTNISHELRTPLTLILGQIETVMENSGGENNRQKLQMAFRNAKQLLRLINQLLDLAKFDAQRMTLNASPGNIVPLLRNLTYSFESLAHKKRIMLFFESEQDEVIINFEQDKIEKIMYNLLSNAFKFTPEGGRISVQLSVISDQSPSKSLNTNDDLLITVRDSGVGIPRDRLPHVFDRFYQADHSQTREFEGTGVGLALTKELVELHGGAISAESEEGFGAAFSVRLPVVSFQSSVSSDQADANIFYKTDAQDFQNSNNPTRPKSIKPTKKGDFVLIVEDNDDVRAYIRQTLENDYRIIEAADGEEGFKRAQEYIPDLIITDVMMPKVDGYALSRMLREDEVTSHIPIIMLTAKAGEDERIEGFETGVDAYLIKPFSAKELRVRIRKLIELRRAIQQNLRESGLDSQESKTEQTTLKISALDQAFLDRLQKLVLENLNDEKFTAPVLSRKIGMSERQLHRKLKSLLDCSPGRFIRDQRIYAAKNLLQDGGLTITEAAFQVGYNSLSSFTRAFRETFGQTPTDFLKQRLG